MSTEYTEIRRVYRLLCAVTSEVTLTDPVTEADRNALCGAVDAAVGAGYQAQASAVGLNGCGTKLMLYDPAGACIYVRLFQHLTETPSTKGHP